ncbi:MAG: Gfo/Idh/MocA family oxidoreductase [Bryobacterales bacterium]|nr:Gfo/Idh/MocA family oxidoreductase [Bryobacterales bacterium]MEB2361570.1 Gfo/Idh/MocA family oxidoreductase [Bryobacterales bacterium]
MNRIKTAVIGAGFMGRVHTEGIRRLGNVDIVACCAVSEEEAAAFGKAMGIERTTADYKTILNDPSIQAVHVCTPNALHYPISLDALNAGKAVLCEKPLTLSVQEAQKLVDLAESKKLPNCVNHNLRYYPVVQQIRCMVEKGELGDILVVQGTYSQDWLLYDTDFNWRIEAKDNGPLRAMGDIGSHWMDMIQHLTGLRITRLCADLQIFHKTRKKPKVAIETFAGKTLKPEDYDEVPIDTDDYGAVLIHLGDRCRGAFTVSQVAAGCKNRFQVEVYGTKGGALWNQERPDELWLGERNSPSRLLLKDPALLDREAATYADLPGGHSEGYDDTHKQIYRRFYRKVADPSAPVEYPTFRDGLRGMQLLEKVLESAKKQAWVDTGLAAAAGGD